MELLDDSDTEGKVHKFHSDKLASKHLIQPVNI